MTNEERNRTREQIKPNLKNYVEQITTRSKGTGKYICPLCASGTGKNATGAFSLKGDSWKCFSCGHGGDIFDLIGEVESIENYNDRFNRACEIYNISTSPHSHTPKHEIEWNEAKRENTAKATPGTQLTEEQPTDYGNFFLKAHENIGNTDYWRKRGLTQEIIDRFKIGYESKWQNPVNPTAPVSPRLIIPTSRYSYIARSTDNNAYNKLKIGKLAIFNSRVLYTSKKPIYVVEGEIDALTVMVAGGEAIALGTTTMVGAFLKFVKTKKPVQPLIIALDNDEAGTQASIKLIRGLQELGIDHYEYNPAGEYKDANEALQSKRDLFEANVAYGERKREMEKREAYEKTSALHHINSFLNGIADNANTPAIPTGFNQLDKVLDGGLYEGLYIIGAISSLGKTTFVMQIADQIAQQGNDILIFSLEMARTEIMSKSISCNTLQLVKENGGNISHAKTSRGITAGTRYKHYCQAEKNLINEAVEKYAKYAGNIYIHEGIGDIDVKKIKETVDEHVKFTGRKPIVIIDYLQLIAPYEVRATDKQNTDKAVLELKRISRDYKIPVFGISSFNRENYKSVVSMVAFKESGRLCHAI